MGLTTTTTTTQQQKSMRSTDILLQQESAHFTPRLHHRLRSIAMVFRLSSAHLRTSGRSTSFRPCSLLQLTPMSTQYCKTQHPNERAPKLNLPARFERIRFVTQACRSRGANLSPWIRFDARASERTRSDFGPRSVAN
jgi:hypothetical protein